jgi:hypothetical protein
LDSRNQLFYRAGDSRLESHDQCHISMGLRLLIVMNVLNTSSQTKCWRIIEFVECLIVNLRKICQDLELYKYSNILSAKIMERI